MILGYTLGIIALIILGLIVIVALRPADFRVVRSAVISAPAAAVFEQVNDFQKWQAWSPWENIDPDLQRTYDGGPAGTGAGYSWVGNKNVGEGRMTITESRPSDLIRIQLEFVRPFACTNDVEFTFRPQGNDTVVTWSMAGKNNFMAKAAGLVMNMDKMIGGMFEQGLAQLKTRAESETATASVTSRS